MPDPECTAKPVFAGWTLPESVSANRQQFLLYSFVFASFFVLLLYNFLFAYIYNVVILLLWLTPAGLVIWQAGLTNLDSLSHRILHARTLFRRRQARCKLRRHSHQIWCCNENAAKKKGKEQSRLLWCPGDRLDFNHVLAIKHECKDGEPHPLMSHKEGRVMLITLLPQHNTVGFHRNTRSSVNTPSQSDTNQVSSVSPNEAACLTHSRQVFSAVVVGGKRKLRWANLPRWRNPDSCFYTHTVTELLGRATLPQILSGVRTINHVSLNCGCLPMFADDDDVSVLTLID